MTEPTTTALPGEPGRENLGELLLSQRKIVTSGILDLAAVNDIAARLMTLDALSDEGIDWTMSSPDGDLDAAFALIDVIDLLGAQVHARCIGHLEGPPVGVFAVCHRRSAAAHAHFRVGDSRTAVACAARQLNDWLRHREQQTADFCARLAQATGQVVDQVATDLQADRQLDVHEALAYGLVDEIIEGDRDRRRRSEIRPRWPHGLPTSD